MLSNWRELKIDDRVYFYGTEFHLSWCNLCTITEKHQDHLIARFDDIDVWIDDDTCEMFKTADNS